MKSQQRLARSVRVSGNGGHVMLPNSNRTCFLPRTCDRQILHAVYRAQAPTSYTPYELTMGDGFLDQDEGRYCFHL